MSEATIAQKGPYKVELEPGEYWFCTCGRSASQPFCDGSHQGSEFQPLAFNVSETSSLWLCGCKRSKNLPFCDGSHNKL